MRIFVGVLLFVALFLRSSGKDYPMLHYTIEDGLPSNTIYDIYQDPEGYMWFGTDKGVSRYNGLKFESLKISLLPTGLLIMNAFSFNRIIPAGSGLVHSMVNCAITKTEFFITHPILLF